MFKTIGYFRVLNPNEPRMDSNGRCFRGRSRYGIYGITHPVACDNGPVLRAARHMSGKCGAVIVPLFDGEGPVPAGAAALYGTGSSCSACATQTSALKHSASFNFLNFILLLLLQILDILSTMLGLRLGAHEANFFVARMMRLGTLPGLLLVKIILLAAVIA